MNEQFRSLCGSRQNRWRPLLALLAILVAPLARAEPDAPPGLTRDGGGRVVAVIDGDTVVLDDGAEIRLVGLQAPKLSLGRRGFAAWPLAEEARSALAGLAQGRQVALAYGGRREDRHGRRLAHLIRDDGLWIQGALLDAGWARVYSFPDNRAGVAAMLAREQTARAARRGIWAHPFYAVRRPEQTAGLRDTFQIVEGRILDAATVRGRTYLNFGQDWREDFTVTIAPSDRRTFAEAGLDPAAWTGRRIRVRGWIGDYNGPVIDVTHPEQIELLEDQ